MEIWYILLGEFGRRRPCLPEHPLEPTQRHLRETGDPVPISYIDLKAREAGKTAGRPDLNRE